MASIVPWTVPPSAESAVLPCDSANSWWALLFPLGVGALCTLSTCLPLSSEVWLCGLLLVGGTRGGVLVGRWDSVWGKQSDPCASGETQFGRAPSLTPAAIKGEDGKAMMASGAPWRQGRAKSHSSIQGHQFGSCPLELL